MLPGKTFSDSWHRIAGLRITLRSTVHVKRQFFRGDKWYLLHDPFNNTFFRIRPEAYQFVSQLRPDKTVEEVWEETLKKTPKFAPGQEDVLRLLTSLYYSNLLFFERSVDSENLFKRYHKRRQREIRSKAMSIMFIRIPLFDPDHFLKRIMILIRMCLSPFGLVVWLSMVGFGIKKVIENLDLATQQAQGILSPDNLILLYLGLVVVKAIHEFAHAAVCRRFGGEVHTMGVMLMVFTPLPYMDATSSWMFRSRAKRILVGSAGMLAEVFVAAIAAVVWANSGAGTLHSLAYNIMFIGSVSTILFNINPLLRFDGYYILSDLIDMPNLHLHANRQMKHLVEKYPFGVKTSQSPAKDRKEAWILVGFGVLSTVYRVVVFTGILLFVADKFLVIGLIMALICIVAWGVIPPLKFMTYLFSSPVLQKTRTRAILVTAFIFVLMAGFLGMVPLPNRFRSPGIIESENYTQVVTGAPGYIEESCVMSGKPVKKGGLLIRLNNHDLDLEIRMAQAQKLEIMALEQKAESEMISDLEPIRKRRETIEKKLNDLEMTRNQLMVRARQDGIWISPNIDQIVGAWVERGAAVGEIIDPDAFRFSAVVSQDDAAGLFNDQIDYSEVRLFGEEGSNLRVTRLSIIPYKHENLPSASLGWLGGGEISVAMNDETGTRTTEPFFQVYADFDPGGKVFSMHGRSGKIRISLQPEALLVQWYRKFRQVIQKRYRI